MGVVHGIAYSGHAFRENGPFSRGFLGEEWPTQMPCMLGNQKKKAI